MTNFINPLNPQQNPTDTEFASISLTTAAQLLWNTQNIVSATEYYVATQTNLLSSAAATITLPDISLASAGASFTLTNIGTFTLAIVAFDNSSVVNITSGQSLVFTMIDNSVSGTQSTAWQTIVLGATTNTNQLSANLGNSLTFVVSTNNVQVKQYINSIQNALTFSTGSYTFTDADAVTYSGCTLFNPPGTLTQVNILLPASNALYGLCGFFCTFVNEASYPVVLQTTGDTINGVPLQSTVDSASFVISPGASVTLTSTPYLDWVIMSQSAQFQSIFKTANLNFSTANYVYLAAPATTNYTPTSILPNSTGAAAVAIDMSNNLDLIYSPLWVLSGTVPTDVATIMSGINQTTVWIILPNNLSYIYFIQGRLSVTTYSVGLAVKYGTANAVGLPPARNAYPAGSGSTWAFQYSAQVNPSSVSLPTQFISNLLITSSGGGGDGKFPDIVDDLTTHTVSIIGSGGFRVTAGSSNFDGVGGAFIGPNPVAVIVPNSTNADIVVTNGAGATRDSGKAFSTSVTMGGASASNNLIPTQLAVRTFVDNAVAGIFDLKGSWNATTNTPTLVQAVGVTGDAYMCTVGGTQTILDAAEFPPSGEFTFSPGDLVFFGATQWHVLEAANFVISVNGQTGVVILTLADIDDVTISGPVNGEGLIYNSGTSKWENNFPTIPGITANGSNVTVTVPLIAQDTATFQSTSVFDGQATFNTVAPIFSGTYPGSPAGNLLATIDYVNDVAHIDFPNITDNPGTGPSDALVTIDAKLTNNYLGTFQLGLTANAPITANATATPAIVASTATSGTAITATSVSGNAPLDIGTIGTVNGIRFFNGGGYNTGAPVRGYDATGEGAGLVFLGDQANGKVFAEWGSGYNNATTNSQLATIADVQNQCTTNAGIDVINGVDISWFLINPVIGTGHSHGMCSFVANTLTALSVGGTLSIPLSSLDITSISGGTAQMIPFSVLALTSNGVGTFSCNLSGAAGSQQINFSYIAGNSGSTGTASFSGCIVW